MAALLVVQFHGVAGSINQSGGGGCATGTGCQRQGGGGGGAPGTDIFQFTVPAAHAELGILIWPLVKGFGNFVCARS